MSAFQIYALFGAPLVLLLFGYVLFRIELAGARRNADGGGVE